MFRTPSVLFINNNNNETDCIIYTERYITEYTHEKEHNTTKQYTDTHANK